LSKGRFFSHDEKYSQIAFAFCVYCRLLTPMQLMKRSRTPDRPSRFEGNLRHYHRHSSQNKKNWEDWVDGVAAKPRQSKNWLSVVLIVIAIIALCGIVVGLIIQLS
jgi:hypothetical protein